MVGKLEGEGKRRGRPRKNRKGRPPGEAIALVPASCQQSPSPPPAPASRRSLRERRPRRVEDYARYDDDYEDGYFSDELRCVGEEEADEVDGEEAEEEEEAEWERRGKKFKLLQKLPSQKSQRQRSPNRGGSAGSASPYSSSDDGARLNPHRKGKLLSHGRDNGSQEDCNEQRREGSGGSDGERKEGERRHAAQVCNGAASGRMDRKCSISTPLPDKKKLESFLDKLQKKDTYGVYAEPVDPEELPDYHDIIEHPMDFATIRKNLSAGKYANLEQFESDVFLICANAMEYNAPSTIYFRQARSIQELARKSFQTIRLEMEDDVKSEQNAKNAVKSEQNAKNAVKSEQNARDAMKSEQNAKDAMKSEQNAKDAMKSEQNAKDAMKSEQNAKDAMKSELNAKDVVKLKSEQNVQSSSVIKKTFSSPCNVAKVRTETMFHKLATAAPISAGKVSTESNAMQPSEQPIILQACIDGNFSENNSEKGDDCSAKDSPIKIGKKQVTLDEDHRATYTAMNELPDDQVDPLIANLDDEPKHLVAVGLDAEYSYARSLARFAGVLGPIAWRIASESIEKALPSGVKFGPGWVGEYEPLPTPVLSFETNPQQHSSSHRLFKHNAESWKNAIMDVQRNPARSIATAATQFFPRKPSDSFTPGAIGRKPNNMENLSVCSPLLKQTPHSFRSKTGSVPIIPDAHIFPHNSLPVTLSKDQTDSRGSSGMIGKTMHSNSSSLIGKIADISAERNRQCSEIGSSNLDFVNPGSKDIVQSGPQHSQIVPHKPNSSTLCIDTRGTPNGKVATVFFGNSGASSPVGFFPPRQMVTRNSCFNLADRTQVIHDPVELTGATEREDNRISCLASVNDNQKLGIPTVPSPRCSSSAAATAAARAWMSVGRSVDQKPVEASRLFKVEGGAAASSLISESHALASGIHEDEMKQVWLPIKAAAEEGRTSHKHVTDFPQLILTESSKYQGQTTWRGLVPQVQQKQRKDVSPPDLNISFHAPGSPVLQSGILMDSQQPDLALQL